MQSMSEAEARILIVRHGEHRGRSRAHYLWRSLTHLKQQRPDLFSAPRVPPHRRACSKSGWDRRRRFLAVGVRFGNTIHCECVAHDLSYWQQKEEHRTLMLKACTAAGVQFAAIDYSNLSDGTPVLWEVNPYFAVSSQIMLPLRRRAPERLVSYHETIGKFLSALLTAPNGTKAARVA